jgi:hypothetical protein
LNVPDCDLATMKRTASKGKPIDLALLPNIGYAHMWLTLDEAAANGIRGLRRALERINDTTRLLWLSDADQKTLAVRSNELGPLREGLLRAALAELFSVEDVLRLDLKELRRNDSVLKMNDTILPHVHFIRELRTHELHLYHSPLTGFQRDLLWGNMAKPKDARPIKIELWRLDGVTVQSFGKLDNAKYYTADQQRAMVDWFNDAQGQWGVQEVVLRVANACAEALGARYFP